MVLSHEPEPGDEAVPALVSVGGGGEADGEYLLVITSPGRGAQGFVEPDQRNIIVQVGIFRETVLYPPSHSVYLPS